MKAKGPGAKLENGADRIGREGVPEWAKHYLKCLKGATLSKYEAWEKEENKNVSLILGTAHKGETKKKETTKKFRASLKDLGTFNI